MGSYSSSSLNNSPFGTERMVTPESPTKDTNSAPMPVKNDGVTIISNSLYSSSPSAKKIFESPSKSTTSVPVASPAVKSRWSFSSSKKSFGIYYKDLSLFLNLTHVLIGLGLCLMFSLVKLLSDLTTHSLITSTLNIIAHVVEVPCDRKQIVIISNYYSISGFLN